MPRNSRIDYPEALHHLIIQGIERKKIFKDNSDKDNFVERLGKVLADASTPCYAWVLMPNHVHLLLKTGTVPITTLMQRLLTGYAQQFNRRHHRHGHLFRNRYQSVLCEEDPYLLELVRYIHLNPLRARMLKDLKGLRAYRYSGHAVLLGREQHEWQDTDYVLKLFGSTKRKSLRNYESFIEAGMNQGRRPELIGGGLVRSVGGWSSLKALRKQRVQVKGNERILGSGAFVERVLRYADEDFEESFLLQRQGWNFETLLSRVADYYGLEPESITSGSKVRMIVKGRDILCYMAVRKLKMSCVKVGKKLGVTQSSVSKAVIRGQSILKDTNFETLILKSPHLMDAP